MIEASAESEPSVDRDVVIACRGLSCGYGSKPIVHGVDLALRRGQISVIVGGSGCGKSTLLKAMVGLLPPMEGQVVLLGQDPYALEGQAFRALLARTGNVFQQGALFSAETVFDNLALPVREHTQLPEEVVDEMVAMRLSWVGLDGYQMHMPAELSGGQRKRVALARASMLDPEVIFCDEPSAGLDPVSSAGLDQTLRQFCDLLGMTVVIVTHELASIRDIADTIVMLGGGGVLSVGPYDAMLNSENPEIHDFFHRVARVRDNGGLETETHKGRR